MVCKYCGAATTKHSVCSECRKLIRAYKDCAGATRARYTVYSRVLQARLEYKLLTLPNPPINLIKMYNNGMWPMSLEYVECDKCGKMDLIGRCSSYKHKIYCSECNVRMGR